MKGALREVGFTAVELVLSLALLSLLLSALTFAVHGAVKSYEVNASAASLNQSARTLLARMVREVRQAQNVDVATNQLRIYPVAGVGNPAEIQYSLEGGVFYYRTTSGGQTTTYELLGSDDKVTVQSFGVSLTTVTQAGETYAVLATIEIVLESDGKTLAITASAAPRRNWLRS